MTSNLRIYIRSMQDKFMFFRFFNEFCTYLMTNFGVEKNNFFETREVSDRLKIAQKEYETKKDNIFIQLNKEVGMNFVK